MCPRATVLVGVKECCSDGVAVSISLNPLVENCAQLLIICEAVAKMWVVVIALDGVEILCPARFENFSERSRVLYALTMQL